MYNSLFSRIEIKIYNKVDGMIQEYIKKLTDGKKIRIKYNTRINDFCDNDGWWSEELWEYDKDTDLFICHYPISSYEKDFFTSHSQESVELFLKDSIKDLKRDDAITTDIILEDSNSRPLSALSVLSGVSIKKYNKFIVIVSIDKPEMWSTWHCGRTDDIYHSRFLYSKDEVDEFINKLKHDYPDSNLVSKEGEYKYFIQYTILEYNDDNIDEFKSLYKIMMIRGLYDNRFNNRFKQLYNRKLEEHE